MLDCNMEIVCYEQQKPNLVEFIILILTHSESLKQIPTVFQKKIGKVLVIGLAFSSPQTENHYFYT